MYIPLVSFVIVALAAFVVAAPKLTERMFLNGTAIPIMKWSKVVNANKTVDLDVLDAHVASVHVILRSFENYERNTGASDIAHANSTIEKRWNDISLTHGPGQSWFGAVYVGTLAKIYYVVFDTASSDLFLPSASCDETCDGHHRWDAGESLTSDNLEHPCDIPYGHGLIVTGDLYTDVVSLAGFSFTANHQILCAARILPPTFQSPWFIPDGVMGMAFPSVSSYGGSPVFQTMISQGEVVNQVFSFSLSEDHGELYINGVNEALYTGPFAFVRVLGQVPGLWLVTMDNLQINGVTITSNPQVIVDTGSLIVNGPTSLIAALHTHLDGVPAMPGAGNGVYDYPCSYRPVITLTFGGRPFTIPPASVSTGTIAGDPSRCVSGFVGLDLIPGENIWVVGEVFLRNVYTTFDVANTMVGFARLAQDGSSGSNDVS